MRPLFALALLVVPTVAAAAESPAATGFIRVSGYVPDTCHTAAKTRSAGCTSPSQVVTLSTQASGDASDQQTSRVQISPIV